MTVYEVLKKQYRELLQAREQALMSGVPKDYAEYRALCGEIQGLNLALREVEDLANRQQEQNDD